MAVPFGEKIKTIFSLLTDFKTARALISQKHTGYLKDIGWFESFTNLSPLSADGSPIPWVTYPFIDFIHERLNKSLTVFEFGAGNSTLYYAKYTSSVTSIEHNKNWYNDLKTQIPSNVNLILYEGETLSGYAKKAIELNKKYNVIIIDAVERVECIHNCLPALHTNGVVILDDSEREEYSEGIEYIMSQGFKKLDFWGIAPGILFKKCTTLFYKSENCLNI